MLSRAGFWFVLAFAACGKGSSATPDPGPASGSVGSSSAKPVVVEERGTWYRAHLVYDKVGELPFFLHLPPKGETAAYVVNGDEKTDFTAAWKDNTVTITGQWSYISVIEATIGDDGTLTGTWTRDTPLWGEVIRDFVAKPIAKPEPTKRFAGDAKPAANVAGIWEFSFDKHEEGKGVLEQGADGVVRGYIKPGQLGDIRFLAGNMHGNKLMLSHFNGNAANLVLADISSDGATMKGLMSMQNVWNESFTAKRVDAYELLDKVKLKKGSTRVSLPGLDKYKGKPTLAIIFATWCSSCNDAAPYLRDLYAKYHPRGLEIMSVAYDLSEDEKANLAELDRFRKKYDIPWELSQVPCTPESWASVMPQELEGWDGLPILMLVRPDGTVQTIFGGWFGPATAADGERKRKWFESSVDALLAHAVK